MDVLYMNVLSLLRVPGVNFDPRGAKRAIKASAGVRNDPRTRVGVKIDPRNPFT